MAKTFDTYDKMPADQLKEQQAKLREDVAKGKAGIVNRTIDVGLGTGVGVGAGVVAGAGAFVLKNSENRKGVSAIIEGLYHEARGINPLEIDDKLGKPKVEALNNFLDNFKNNSWGNNKVPLIAGATVALGAALYVGHKLWKSSTIAAQEKKAVELGYVNDVMSRGGR